MSVQAKNKKANISDVAKQAGVSIKTVSRVLNNEKYVKEETQKKVLAAFKALNYRPNMQARGLAGDKSFIVGLLVDRLRGDYVIRVQDGILRACDRYGAHLIVEVLGNRKSGDKMTSLLNAAKFDGIILCPPMSDDVALLEQLKAENVPVVRVAGHIDSAGTSITMMDDVAAAKQIVQHLIEAGHEKIGFIKGNPDHSSARDREIGYLDALKEAAIPVNPAYMQQGQYVYASGAQAATALLSLDAPPTAIFASNDEMAAAVISTADTMGFTVPDDLSVVGFDDSEAAEFYHPPLTTIRQPVEEMAARAVDIIYRDINRDQKMKDAVHKIDHQLIKRQSVQQPA